MIIDQQPPRTWPCHRIKAKFKDYCWWFRNPAPPRMYETLYINNGISTTCPSTGELIPDFWLPSTVILKNLKARHEETVSLVQNTLATLAVRLVFREATCTEATGSSRAQGIGTLRLPTSREFKSPWSDFLFKDMWVLIISSLCIDVAKF